MRKLFLFVIIALLFAACRSDEPDTPPPNGGTNGDGGSSVVEVPRVDDTPVPTPTPLPTAMPLPTRELPDHVFVVEPSTIHIVQPGDTLTKIANQYEVTVKAISDANRHYNFDLIKVGDKLYIPPCE